MIMHLALETPDSDRALGIVDVEPFGEVCDGRFSIVACVPLPDADVLGLLEHLLVDSLLIIAATLTRFREGPLEQGFFAFLGQMQIVGLELKFFVRVFVRDDAIEYLFIADDELVACAIDTFLKTTGA